MYTSPIRHTTPNLLEGAPLNLSGVSDYMPQGVTAAWNEIKGQVTDVTSSTMFGYAAIGMGALFIWYAVSGLGGKKRR